MATNQSKTIIYYHKPCNDGVAGAWCAWNYFEHKRNYGPIEYNGCMPGKELMFAEKNIANNTIYFIDVLPTRNIPFICEHAKAVIILDHHKTNQEYIATLPKISNLTVIFDLERSGAQIAWDYFNGDIARPWVVEYVARPWFIDYVGDRDLWTWKLPNSREINLALLNQGHLDSIDELDRFYKANEDTEPEAVMAQMADCGRAIESYQKRIINQAVKNAILLNFNDPVSGISAKCWAGTINPDIVSELGNVLAEKELPDGTLPLFSVIYSYYILNDEYRISFRSSNINPMSADVSKIAKSMDPQGGGHMHAAGCKVDSKVFWQYFSKTK